MAGGGTQPDKRNSISRFACRPPSIILQQAGSMPELEEVSAGRSLMILLRFANFDQYNSPHVPIENVNNTIFMRLAVFLPNRLFLSSLTTNSCTPARERRHNTTACRIGSFLHLQKRGEHACGSSLENWDRFRFPIATITVKTLIAITSLPNEFNE